MLKHREDLTAGAHNLHDRAGVPTFFADAVLFTEAIPTKIRSRAKVLASRHELLVSKRQPDLAISYRPSVFGITSTAYRLAHEGRDDVTPHRGTFVAKGWHRQTGREVALVVEHRINAAFDPWVRGEPTFREYCWHKHTEMTIDWVDELRDDGHLVIGGGDLNTPRGVSGYEGHLEEVGHGLDRIGVSHSVYVMGWTTLSREGSDHPRLRASLDLPS